VGEKIIEVCLYTHGVHGLSWVQWKDEFLKRKVFEVMKVCGLVLTCC
jgi:hypothetical protein